MSKTTNSALILPNQKLNSSFQVPMSMDISCGSLSSEKQKLLERKGSDRLSDLPDCVLHYVLSFLKTKEAVRTSVLSRRWQYLWTCIANIDMEYELPYTIQDIDQRKKMSKIFLDFMDRLFSLHNASNIRELHLKIPLYVENFRLNSWICAVRKHKVQDLNLHFEVKGHPILPFCLSNHHSLVVLKLNVECTLKALVGTHFPFLKTLYLSRVRFMDDLSFEHLFSSCPVLDELAFVNGDWENIQDVSISIPSLRNLTIEYDEEYFDIYDHMGRDQYVSDPHVKIIATNLACLTFASYLDINFEVSGLSSLEAANIFLPYDEGLDDEIANRTLSLFSQTKNVEKMILYPRTLETLIQVEASLTRLPTFYNLTRLTVDWVLYFDCCEFLLAFLDKMPKLEYLHFPQGCDKEVSQENISLLPAGFRDVIVQKRVPTCFSSSFKTFAIEDFEAGLLEVVMIEYVLRNATRLESLIISCHKSLVGNKFVSKAKEHLLKVPRSSESCNIVFPFD